MNPGVDLLSQHFLLFLFTWFHGESFYFFIIIFFNLNRDPGSPQGSCDGGAGLDRVRDEVRRRCPVHPTVSPQGSSLVGSVRRLGPATPVAFASVACRRPPVDELVRCRHLQTCSGSFVWSWRHVGRLLSSGKQVCESVRLIYQRGRSCESCRYK